MYTFKCAWPCVCVNGEIVCHYYCCCLLLYVISHCKKISKIWDKVLSSKVGTRQKHSIHIIWDAVRMNLKLHITTAFLCLKSEMRHGIPEISCKFETLHENMGHERYLYIISISFPTNMMSGRLRQKILISNIKSMKETVVCVCFFFHVGPYFYYNDNISNIKHYSQHILML